MNKKVCPIMTSANVKAVNVTSGVEVIQCQKDCILEDCAIYDDKRKCCGLIAREFVDIRPKT